jgi:hypothetical protein
MPEFRLIPRDKSIDRAPGVDRERISEPERELNSFINSMTNLIGSAVSGFLAKAWLGELTCRGCTPGSESFNWRSVSLSASMKLASRVIGSLLSDPCSL